MVNQGDHPGPRPAPVTQELLGLLGLPAQMVAMIQQLNHNLETLQDAQVLGQLERLNTNLESMAPELKSLTEALNNFLLRMWGQKTG